MIITVTPNTSLDVTYTIENFRLGRVNRPSDVRVCAGGKGINVARVFAELGGKAVALGMVGGHNGDIILDGLKSERFEADFVRTSGESRVCIAIVDPETTSQTEVNEVGPSVSDAEVDELKARFRSRVASMDFAVLSGSIPPGMPDGIYRSLIEIARERGVRCVLDSSGEPMRQGLEAVPYIAKPNIAELSYVVGRQVGTIDEAVVAASEILERGVKIVIVTLGREGAIALTSDGAWHARPPKIEFVSSVGSGDSLAAAFVHELLSGGSVEDALRIGTAAGAANAEIYGAGFCRREDILRLNEQVEITRLQGE